MIIFEDLISLVSLWSLSLSRSFFLTHVRARARGGRAPRAAGRAPRSSARTGHGAQRARRAHARSDLSSAL